MPAVQELLRAALSVAAQIILVAAVLWCGYRLVGLAHRPRR